MTAIELRLDYHGPTAALGGRGAFIATFEVTQLAGAGGFDSPHLLFPLAVEPTDPRGAVRFDLFLLAAELHLGALTAVPSGVEGLVGRATVPIWGSLSSFRLAVPLTSSAVERIEVSREDRDLDLSLSLCAPLAVRAEGPLTAMHPAAGSVTFRIPRSHWVDHVLPGLGYLTKYILELDVPARGDLTEPFQRALSALRGAEEALRRDSYSEVFVQCRSAIEAVARAFRLDLEGEKDSHPARVEAFRKQQLVSRIGDTKGRMVADELRALWGPLSAAAHGGPSTVDRPAAKYVLQSTANLLGYLGTIFAE